MNRLETSHRVTYFIPFDAFVQLKEIQIRIEL